MVVLPSSAAFNYFGFCFEKNVVEDNYTDTLFNSFPYHKTVHVALRFNHLKIYFTNIVTVLKSIKNFAL